MLCKPVNGYTESTHDATAWKGTSIYANHNNIFEAGEFIWGDLAYPVCSIFNSTYNISKPLPQIDYWVVCPFRKPESEEPENSIYNNYVSKICIHSEHAIGFLKGRFQSLKGLRVNIHDKASHRFATYWVISCIAVHSFVMTCEAEEQTNNGNNDSDAVYDDEFIQEGLETDSEDSSSQSASSSSIPKA